MLRGWSFLPRKLPSDLAEPCLRVTWEPHLSAYLVTGLAFARPTEDHETDLSPVPSMLIKVLEAVLSNQGPGKISQPKPLVTSLTNAKSTEESGTAT